MAAPRTTTLAIALVALSLAGMATAQPTPASDSRDLLVLPGHSYDFTFVAQGSEVIVSVGLYNGASLHGSLDGPGTCDGKAAQMTVIGVSTSGDSLLKTSCGVLAGQQHLRFDAGDSAFHGVLRIQGARFA